MALAKAFPEIYQYELNEPTAVRTTFLTFTRIIYSFCGINMYVHLRWTVNIKQTVVQAS